MRSCRYIEDVPTSSPPHVLSLCQAWPAVPLLPSDDTAALVTAPSTASAAATAASIATSGDLPPPLSAGGSEQGHADLDGNMWAQQVTPRSWTARGNRIDTVALVSALPHLLRCPTLTAVDVSHNAFGDAGVLALAQGLPDALGLSAIDVSHCDLHDRALYPTLPPLIISPFFFHFFFFFLIF